MICKCKYSTGLCLCQTFEDDFEDDILFLQRDIVKPVLRGHPRGHLKLVLKTDDHLMQVNLSCIMVQGIPKRW